MRIRGTSSKRLAESRTLSIELSVQVRSARIQIWGLCIVMACLLGVAAASGVSLLGYFHPPAIAEKDLPAIAGYGIVLGGCGAALLSRFVLKLWTAATQADLIRQRLDAAIAAH